MDERSVVMELKKLRITTSKIDILHQLGIQNAFDLLTYYPYRYEILEKKEATIQDPKLCMDGVIFQRAVLNYRKQNQSKMTFQLLSDGKLYRCAIFNRHFMQSKLKEGVSVTITGKLDSKDQITVADLKFGSLQEQTAITPVYALKEGLRNSSLIHYIAKALDQCLDEIEDFIPESYLEKYRLISKKEALMMIHRPRSTNDIKHALRHLKYEEFLKFQLMVVCQGERDVKQPKIFSQDKIDHFITQLPFTLTDDQKQACDDILKDLERPVVMNRLVQGDVGSGKTIVSVICMYATVLSGNQCALMAPTEILAQQHYEKLCEYYKDTTVEVALLTGSKKASEKKHIYDMVKNHEVDVVVGTHALIQEGLDFHSLGLVVTDEQHRFGVKQRESLKQKGKNVDVLLMSATPIPRTLAITLFGDMDVSSIHTMPLGRRPVITKYYQGDTMKPILGFLKSYLATGQQCYVVCPLVAEGESGAKDAMSIYQGMTSYFHGHYNVGLLHGKMSDDEKSTMMQAFRNNDIQILVSTTVIEVGVDVGNANLMVIYNADRFGLAQLHQLRGRVGRKDKQGYCFLLSSSENESSIDRIKFLEKSNDGFEISEYDLKLRGPGEVLGYRQAGLPTFKIANIFEDYQMLQVALADAKNIYNHLDDYPKIKEYLKDSLKELKN